MPLKLIEIRDLKSYFDGFGPQFAGTDRWVPSGGMGLQLGGGIRHPGYFEIGDFLLWGGAAVPNLDPEPGNAVENFAFYADSQARDLEGRNRDDWATTAASIAVASSGKFYMGQPMLEAGIQYAYIRNLANSTIVTRVLRDSLSTDGTQFPNFDPSASQNVTPSTHGHYASTADQFTQTTETERQFIMFEGITDSTGYAEIYGSSGGATNHSHPLGLALVPVNDALYLSQAAGDPPPASSVPIPELLSDAWAWVDVSTGNAVGFLDVPFSTNGSSLRQSEPNLDGESFVWAAVQFVPDADSLDARPKGELHFFCLPGNRSATTDPNFPRVGQFDDLSTYLANRTYVRVVDFNPFNLTTGANRVHTRERLVAAIDIPYEPIFQGGDAHTMAADPLNWGGGEAGHYVFYHKPTSSYCMWQGRTNFAPTTPTNAIPAALEWAFFRWRRGLSVDHLSSTFLGSPLTGATVRKNVVAHGDFGQRVSGLVINATLQRVSTYGEDFTPATPTSVYAVAAGEIDNDGTLEVYEGDDPATGTLLAETTNYTVNYGTGQITGVNFNGGQVHTVVYRHRNVPLSPSHGTLVNSVATTNENGVARFDITYADDSTLAGRIDQFTATDA